MKAEEQRIAIAEVMGWRIVDFPEHRNGPKRLWVQPNGEALQLGTPDALPDYLNDLNACHEMENALKSCQDWGRYEGELAKLVEDEQQSWWFTHATAAQRCEAFLKTLGLWKETK